MYDKYWVKQVGGGWVAHQLTTTDDGRPIYEHMGYVFETEQDAQNYTNGIMPTRAIRIDWDKLPGKDAETTVFFD